MFTNKIVFCTQAGVRISPLFGTTKMERGIIRNSAIGALVEIFNKKHDLTFVTVGYDVTLTIHADSRFGEALAVVTLVNDNGSQVNIIIYESGINAESSYKHNGSKIRRFETAAVEYSDPNCFDYVVTYSMRRLLP